MQLNSILNLYNEKEKKNTLPALNCWNNESSVTPDISAVSVSLKIHDLRIYTYSSFVGSISA